MVNKRLVNRTVTIVCACLLLGALVVGFGQACGKGQTLDTFKVRPPRALPPPSSLITFQPALAPHISCKIYLTADSTKVFRGIDTVTSLETFNPSLFPEEDQSFTIDCSGTTSSVVEDNKKLVYRIEFKDDDFAPVSDKIKELTNSVPKFTYAVKHGSYVGIVKVTDTLGLRSEREFLLQVKCLGSLPIQLDISKLSVRSVEELDRTARDQRRATGDRYEYDPSQLVMNVAEAERAKFAYSFDFNGDGIFDPFRDGWLFKTWDEMNLPYDDNDGIIEEGDGIPFKDVYSYFRGRCDYNSASQTCRKDGAGKPVIDTKRFVKVRVLDTECNVYAEGQKEVDFGIDEDGNPNLFTPVQTSVEQFYQVASMIPNQFGSMYLVTDWLGLKNPTTGLFNDDIRIHNIHYIGVTPLKEQLSNEDRFLFRFNRGIGFSGQPRHLTQVIMRGQSKYDPTDINKGRHGMEVELLFQDLTILAQPSLRFKGIRTCDSTDPVYDPTNPRIVTPCLKRAVVYGGGMNETSGLYSEDVQYAPSDASSCEFEFEMERMVPATSACLLTGGEIFIFPTALAPQNVTLKEDKAIKWTNKDVDGASTGVLKIFKRGTSSTEFIPIFNDVTLAPGQSTERGFTEPGTYKYQWIASATKEGFLSVEPEVGPSPTPTPSATPVPQGGELGLETTGKLFSATTQKGFKIKWINKATASSGTGTLTVFKPNMRNMGAVDWVRNGIVEKRALDKIFEATIAPQQFAEFLFTEPAVYRYTWSANPSKEGFIAVLDDFAPFQSRPFEIYINGKIKCDKLDNGAVEPEGGSISLEDVGPNPRDLRTKKGFKVKWTNKNTVGAPGTLTLLQSNISVPGGFEKILDKLLSGGEEFEFTFQNAKAYKYSWAIASQVMEGTITVIDDPPLNQRRFMKFESGQFFLRMGDSEKGICGEPGPGAGDDGPPPKEPPAL